MGRTTDAGFSATSTPLKWERLEYLLATHINICKALIARMPWLSRYVYYDFYAGPGLYPGITDGFGSPIRALQILRASGLPHHAFLFEPNHMAALKHAIATLLGPVPATFGNCTCETAIHDLTNYPKPKIGLAFFDPNGQADWPSIHTFAANYHYIDVLINLNTATIKRMVKSPRHKSDRPMDYLKRLNKQWIFLWDPHPNDRFQFCLAFCTNMKKFPEFRRLGFYELQHERGRAIEQRINYTADEREQMNNHTGFLSFMET
jgi:three-Cys-motif partner protein